MISYPKRLIEVDLPIARISAHARREKSIRHGHISTLHIWWARRPLAACRAVICAALWPDPADPLCPPAFRQAAVVALAAFARRVNPERINEEGRRLQQTVSLESRGRWEALAAGTLTLDPDNPVDMPILRMALLDFIADFANWDNSTVPAYLETARRLTGVAHQALSDPGYELPLSFAELSAHLAEAEEAARQGSKTVFGGVAEWLAMLDQQLSTLPRPLVVDPFAGGGSIPLEALRVGADAFASDLNPVAVLLNKVVLEYIPKYGNAEIRMQNAEGKEVTFHGLAEAVRYWGNWVKEQAEKELAEFYPKDPDGSTPIAYLWARTILSEAPGQGDVPVEVPLIRSLWLCKKPNRKVALRWVRDTDGTVQTETVDVTYADGVTRKVRRPLLEIFEPKKESEVEAGTSARGKATCPVTHHTTPAKSVRSQLRKRKAGSDDGRMLAVVMIPPAGAGRYYRAPSKEDISGVNAARCQFVKIETMPEVAALIPNESTPTGEGKGAGRAFSQRIYGMDRFRDAYTSRQLLVLTTLARCIGNVGQTVEASIIRTFLSLVLGRVNDLAMTLCRWRITAEAIAAANGGQNKMPVIVDFVEANTFGDRGGDWGGQVEWVIRFIEHVNALGRVSGSCVRQAAQLQTLPENGADAWITDPPYYDAFPYSDLSDFFFVWLKRSVPAEILDYREELVPKDDEIVVYDVRHGNDDRVKDQLFFATEMTRACETGRLTARPDGIGVVVFANKTTAGWEALIQSLISAGWVATASWPIDTEREGRQRAQGSAALNSSVHVVCRPRENTDGTVTESVGEWRDVLGELPKRIHEWMPRLAAEGVVGADAIFACLGPALEIFSRYSRVEKSNGEPATLREYLEFVWAAVSTEALSLIFKEADASGLEPDARLTAMWLWTIGGAANGNGKALQPGALSEEERDEEAEDEYQPAVPAKAAGFTLEYDAARKIAQGLGVHLEQCTSLVEIKGDKARLLPVAERTAHLFGKNTQAATTGGGRRKKVKQQTLFEELDAAEAAEAGWTEIKGPPPGATVLDRVHQSMILFAANRGELLKRFLVEDGVGKDPRFWKLADNLNKLYPPGTEERRWVEGVLARKKGLGL